MLPSRFHPESARDQARALYAQGWRIAAIAQYLQLPRSTVSAWKKRDYWAALTSHQRLDLSLETRLSFLINKADKTGKDFKEIDLLMRQSERLSGCTPASAKRPKPLRNTFSDAQRGQLREAFLESLFDYQKVWYQAGRHRTRNLLKSRQIGATWYFAREALLDAIETGRNQIFLSASKAQAQVFKQYLTQFAKEAAQVELRGDPIVLANGATLYFLGTNARTAQSYHGNFYFDEYFWVPQFTTLNKVASGMAMQARWRKTYFSTPSSLAHEAYDFWRGASGQRGETSRGIDISHTALAPGCLCEDHQWRQIVTIEDAQAGGCNLFDLDILKKEYRPEDYANLLQCQFIDDTAAVFPLADLQRGMVDTWTAWTDVQPLQPRPLGDRPVWIGYDPSLSRDAAGCAVVAPPGTPDGVFRVLEKYQWRGLDFAAQAEKLHDLTQRYHVTHLTLDMTGIGQGVFQLVKHFFPAVAGLHYSPEVKARLVMKAQIIIRQGRLQFDAGWTDLAQALMAIRHTPTAQGRQLTYTASRTAQTGHADLAWACLHALDPAPWEGQPTHHTAFMEFYR